MLLFSVLGTMRYVSQVFFLAVLFYAAMAAALAAERKS